MVYYIIMKYHTLPKKKKRRWLTIIIIIIYFLLPKKKVISPTSTAPLHYHTCTTPHHFFLFFIFIYLVELSWTIQNLLYSPLHFTFSFLFFPHISLNLFFSSRSFSASTPDLVLTAKLSLLNYSKFGSLIPNFVSLLFLFPIFPLLIHLLLLFLFFFSFLHWSPSPTKSMSHLYLNFNHKPKTNLPKIFGGNVEEKKQQ